MLRAGINSRMTVLLPLAVLAALALVYSYTENTKPNTTSNSMDSSKTVESSNENVANNENVASNAQSEESSSQTNNNNNPVSFTPGHWRPASETNRYTYRVVKSYPHDPTAFTQGLAFQDGVLYEGTGLNGKSSLRKVDLETGEVLKQLDLPAQYFGEGIAVFNGKIYQITWREGKGFIYDLATWNNVGNWSYTTEGWGLTNDDTHIIMSDGSNALYFLNPQTLAKVKQINVEFGGDPVRMLNELEYIDGEIYANVWMTNSIAIINPTSGQVVAWIGMDGVLSPSDQKGRKVDVLNGIAYNKQSNKLYITGKLWPKLYEIELVPL